MATGVHFALSLEDHLSTPAARMEQSIARLDGGLIDISDRLSRVDRASGAVAGGLSRVERVTTKLDGVVDAHVRRLREHEEAAQREREALDAAKKDADQFAAALDELAKKVAPLEELEKQLLEIEDAQRKLARADRLGQIATTTDAGERDRLKLAMRRDAIEAKVRETAAQKEAASLAWARTEVKQFEESLEKLGKQTLPMKALEDRLESLAQAAREANRQSMLLEAGRTTDPARRAALLRSVEQDMLTERLQKAKAKGNPLEVLGAKLAPVAVAFGALTFAIGRAVDGLRTVADVAHRFSRFVLENKAQEQRTRRALEQSEGGREWGEVAMHDLQRFSRMFAMPIAEAESAFTKLRYGGFSRDEAFETMQVVSDMQAFGFENTDDITRALTQMKTKPKASLEEIQGQLADHGVSSAGVYDAIAQRMGLAPGPESRQAVLDAISSGQVEGETAYQGAMDFLVERFSGGKAGSVAAARAQDITGLETTLGDRLNLLTRSLDVSRVEGKYKELLSNLEALTAPGTELGKRIVGLIEKFSSAFEPLLDRYSGVDGMAQLETDLNKLVGALEKVAGLLRMMAQAVRFGLEAFVDPIGTSSDKLSWWQKGIKNAFTSLPSGGGLVMRGLDWVFSDEPKTQLASGGIVTRPTRALVGEGGEAEAVIPLSRLPSMVRQVSGGRPVSVHAPISVVVHGGGAEAASEVATRVREELADVFAELGLQAGMAA